MPSSFLARKLPHFQVLRESIQWQSQQGQSRAPGGSVAPAWGWGACFISTNDWGPVGGPGPALGGLQGPSGKGAPGCSCRSYSPGPAPLIGSSSSTCGQTAHVSSGKWFCFYVYSRLPSSEIGEHKESQLCRVITDHPPAAAAAQGGLAGYLGNMYIASLGFYCTVSTINLLF